jgi:hypothetical protein
MRPRTEVMAAQGDTSSRSPSAPHKRTNHCVRPSGGAADLPSCECLSAGPKYSTVGIWQRTPGRRPGWSGRLAVPVISTHTVSESVQAAVIEPQ